MRTPSYPTAQCTNGELFLRSKKLKIEQARAHGITARNPTSFCMGLSESNGWTVVASRDIRSGTSRSPQQSEKPTKAATVSQFELLRRAYMETPPILILRSPASS